MTHEQHTTANETPQAKQKAVTLASFLAMFKPATQEDRQNQQRAAEEPNQGGATEST